MRPGIFTPENSACDTGLARGRLRFNEAGDFHPRKQFRTTRRAREKMGASMRPGIFTPENPKDNNKKYQRITSFNEAGDFHPRKQAGIGRMAPWAEGFNEAGDFHPRKLCQIRCLPIISSGFNEAGDFHPRKQEQEQDQSISKTMASMRPGIFTPENDHPFGAAQGGTFCFNEAGDFHPRKPKLELQAAVISLTLQ